jgi:hypothetical protein
MSEVPSTAFKVRYSSLDGYRQSRSFKTLEGARKYAQKWVGEHPDTSWNYNYAVSSDGVGKVTANVPMATLFPGSDA